jgi:hypothetical protein
MIYMMGWKVESSMRVPWPGVDQRRECYQLLSARSSSLITLSRPSNQTRLRTTNRSLYHAAPALWNSLPVDLRQISHNYFSTSPLASSPSDFYKKGKAKSLSLHRLSLLNRSSASTKCHGRKNEFCTIECRN